MKKVTVICVGKVKEKFFADGTAEYAKRLSRFCDLEFDEIPDDPSPDEVKRESDAILKKMRGFTVLCDVDGKTLSSEELSAVMDKAYLTSPEITFIIGGSRGVDSRVKSSASLRLSFGRMTFPHQLMRLILAEQIYRAFSISGGLPYHK